MLTHYSPYSKSELTFSHSDDNYQNYSKFNNAPKRREFIPVKKKKHSFKKPINASPENISSCMNKKFEFNLYFANTNVGNYNIATIRLDYDQFETSIWCPKMNLKDHLNIGHYVRISHDKKTALNKHLEAIWYIQNLNREGES